MFVWGNEKELLAISSFLEIHMSNIQIFEAKEIRSFWDEAEQRWYFAVTDVIVALTDSKNPRVYWSQLKRREKEASGQLFTFCKQFKLKAPDGKMRETDCADVEGIFRIIQSVPSPKAEPFKQWLAQVGRERLEEVENPELAAERMKELYRAKGYDEEWIEKRLQSIVVRNELTDEWQQRGVQPGIEYGLLTSEISLGTFNITPTEHKKLKSLKRENLRDHMTPLELILTMLGEATTTEIARAEDAQGFGENKQAARRGGQAAGRARQAIEAETGKPVVTPQNYLPSPKEQKRLEDSADDSPF